MEHVKSVVKKKRDITKAENKNESHNIQQSNGREKEERKMAKDEVGWKVEGQGRNVKKNVKFE